MLLDLKCKITMPRRKQKVWLCGACSENCGNGETIYCENCKRWLHRECENRNKGEFELLATISIPYICKMCCNFNGEFNYKESLQRLQVR